MNTKLLFFENCWTLVHTLKVNLLIIEEFGEVRAYVIRNFRSKSRDYFLNEVEGAQDVTSIVENIQINFALPNELSLQSQLNNCPRVNFKFGHDNYKWLMSIEKNIY